MNCDALRDLVTLVQFKNMKKILRGTLLKVTLYHGCFSRILNCANGTKWRKASQLKMLRILFGEKSRSNIPSKNCFFWKHWNFFEELSFKEFSCRKWPLLRFEIFRILIFPEVFEKLSSFNTMVIFQSSHSWKFWKYR